MAALKVFVRLFGMAWIAVLAVIAWQYTPGLGTPAAPAAKPAALASAPAETARPRTLVPAPAPEAPRVVYQGNVTGSTSPARPAQAAPGVPAAPAPVPAPQAAPVVAPAPQVAARIETPAAPAASPGRVDLNTASVAELNALGGGMIGRAIVGGRPYASPEDLLAKRVLNRATFVRIKDQIAAN